MKLSHHKLIELCSKHIAELSDSELNLLANEFGLKFSNVKRTGWYISLEIKNGTNKICVDGIVGSACSIGRNRKTKNGISNMICCGGSKSFLAVLKICIRQYWNSWEVPLDEGEDDYTSLNQKIKLIYDN